MRSGPLACLLLLLLPLLARPVAAVTVYATPVGAGDTNNGAVELTSGTVTIDVYIERPGSPGVSDCRPGGTGDVICGYDVVLKLEGDGYFATFTNTSATVFPDPVSFTVDTTEIRAVFVDAANAPTSVVPLLIGSLGVADISDSTAIIAAPGYSVGANPQLPDWSGGNRVLIADLSLEVVPENQIAVPEIGVGLSWLVGLPALALLFARHRRRARRRVAG